MKLKKWVTYIIILIILTWLIFFVDWGCEEKEQNLEELDTNEITGDVINDLDCPAVKCEVCEEFDRDEECNYDDKCPSCSSCPSCPEAKTIVKGADELASTSLISLETYNERIINIDNENFTYWLYNSKDYNVNNIHAKMVIEIDDDTDKTIYTDVFSLDKRQNKSFKIYVGLDPRDEEYQAALTIYSGNNNGKTKDVEFKVHNKNPDIEQSEAFWSNSIVGFSKYEINTDNLVNLTLINNKNSEVTILDIKVDDKHWFVNQTLASGEEFEFTTQKDMCDSGIYSFPVYMNYSSGGFEFEIDEEQELVGYCN